MIQEKFQDFTTLSLSVIIEALPFVILGILISIVVQIWLPRNLLLRILPQKSFLRRIILSFCGVLMPVCECGNVPLARTLIAKGLTPAEALTFLLAAPILNPITIITTQQAFARQPEILIFRLLGGFLIANLVGWIFAKSQKNTMLSEGFLQSCEKINKHNHRGREFRECLKIFRDETEKLIPALIFGAMVAATVQVFVPREILMTAGGNPLFSILAMLALAFVVSVCSSVDAFFALAFQSNFTAGSLVSFLVFGPMIDIKMLSLMRTTFRAAVLLKITIIVALTSLGLGLVVNYAF